MSKLKNTNLIDQAARVLMNGAEDAFFVLDKEGKILFLNKKAEKLTKGSKENVLGNNFENVVTIAEREEVKIKKDYIEPNESLEVSIETLQGTVPAEIVFNPIGTAKDRAGTVLIVKLKPKKSAFLRSVEAAGSAIQRYSNVQKIYETLGEALESLDITLWIFPLEKDFFSVGYHTSDRRKVHITEFVTGMPLSEVRLTFADDAFRKITEQKSFFFFDISSILESATAMFTTSQVRKVFSLLNFARGVVVPLTHGDELIGVTAMLSEELTPEDALPLSTLGVQVSAALERARHFEQMVVDLKALEEQISTRTQELEKVKSQMESIVQSSVDAIMAADLEGAITFINKGVEMMFGYTEAEIIGQPITKYYAKGKKEAKRLRKIIMEKGQIENTELDFLAKGGREVHTLASLSLLKNERGITTGIMAVLKDITEQKKLQQTLESLNKAAFRIQKSRTREEIFAVTAEELKQFDFYVVFVLFDEERTVGRVVYVPEKKVLRILEELGGKSLEDYELPLDNTFYKKLIKKKEAIFVKNLQAAMKQVTPPSMQDTAEKGISLLQFASMKSVLVPLIIHGETKGFLAVISHFITFNDIPPMMAFANQVSTALENARLLEESRNRADELARNLEEQQMLRELNTKLFLAQSREEVLDAAIEGIHRLGKYFSNISIINEKRTHATIFRLEMEPALLRIMDKMTQVFTGRSTLLGYTIPVWEEDNIYHQFFNDQIPLITSTVKVEGYPVMRADLSEVYMGVVPGESVLQQAVKRIFPFPFQSVMVFPIIVGGRTMGTLTVASNDVFSERDFTLMNTMGEMVSSAMERIGQAEKLTETFNELRAVQRINTLLNMGASLEEILTQVCTSIKEVYHYQFAYPLLLDPSLRFLTFDHVFVPDKLANRIRRALGVDIKDFKYPISEDFSLFKTIRAKKCLIWQGFEEMIQEIPVEEISSALKTLSSDLSKALGLKPGENSIMIAPLPYGEDVIGILFLGHRKSLTEEDFQHLEYFLDQVGIAIAKSEVESRLRKSLEELRELDQMKSEFIDIASHELRTPLTTLKLYLEMMALEQYGKLTAPLKERIQVMEEGVTRLEEIINQTLVASRLIKNKLRLNKKPVSLLEIATEVVHQLRPLWNAKNQNIFLESPPHLSDAEGDKKALFTVLSNLVDNAIRYSPEHTEILLTFTERPEEVECMVIDQGCGIPPEHLEKIFDEFYIVPSETEYARMDGRTGLGLFIAKGIIEQHKGRIWVESTVGEGSAFHIVVPKKEKE